jgi:hypothetical protein
LLIKKVSFKKLLKVESTMLCENPKTNVAARNSWKSRGKFRNLFLVRVIMCLTLFCHSGFEDCVCPPLAGAGGGRFVVTDI